MELFEPICSRRINFPSRGRPKLKEHRRNHAQSGAGTPWERKSKRCPLQTNCNRQNKGHRASHTFPTINFLL